MAILFHPDPLTEVCKLYPVLKGLGIDFHNYKTKPFDLFIYWSYHKSIAEQDEFTLVTSGLNKGCFDVSKTKINEVFDNIIVNPETYSGVVVRKTELQCSLDEVVLQCPTTKQDGYIYRKFIDTFENEKPTDLRLFYFGEIKFICKKTYLGAMFDRHNYIWEPQPLFTIPIWKRQEIETKCKSYGFDIGEIDVLKDSNTGECFVIDINNVSGIAYNWNFKEYKWLRNLFEKETDKYFKSL